MDHQTISLEKTGDSEVTVKNSFRRGGILREEFAIVPASAWADSLRPGPCVRWKTNAIGLATALSTLTCFVLCTALSLVCPPAVVYQITASLATVSGLFTFGYYARIRQRVRVPAFVISKGRG